MTIKKLTHILKELEDRILSIYLYHKGDHTIPVIILKDLDFVSLDALRHFFVHEKFIILTQDDIQEGSDVFCLKLSDMKNHSELFHGKDILSDIRISRSDLRSALELEIRNKRIQLREEYLSQSHGRDFLKYLLPGMRIIWEGALFLKHPDKQLPSDIKELILLFDEAWSCNSQIFHYLLDDRVEDKKIPSLIHDIHTYLSDVCIKIDGFIL